MHAANAKFNSNEYCFHTYGRGDRISRRLMDGKFHEYRTLNAIRKIGAVGVYMDIGAHIGNHSVFFGCECPSTEVISFEASPENRELLEYNLGANLKKPYQVVPHIIGREGETFDLEDNYPDNSGAKRFTPGTSISARSLDSLFPELSNVALIKLDIEGGEPGAIEGGIELIRRNLPLLVVETESDTVAKATEQLLVPLGYKKTKSLNAPPNVFWRARKGLLGWHN